MTEEKPYPRSTDRTFVVVYDKTTGIIRQRVECVLTDQHRQHSAFPNCDYLDVTETCPEALPHTHMVDLATLTIIPRTTPLDEAQRDKERELIHACEDAIVGGFLSGGWLYPSNRNDQTNMQQAAMVGGSLWRRDPNDPSGWAMAEHTPEQGRQLLSDFATHRDAQRARLQEMKGLLASAANLDAVTNLKWS